MKVLFTSQPAVGHWHPLVPLARALVAAGHEVVFAATEGFCPTVEANGFLRLRAGEDEGQEVLRQRIEQSASLTPREQAVFMLKHVFAGTRAQRSLPDLIDLISDWQPDILVHENVEFAGCVAAEGAGIPHAAVQVTAPRDHFLPMIAGPFKALLEIAGLPQTEPDEILYRYLLLSPRPPSLWNPAVLVPTTTHAYKYSGFSASGEEGMPAWFADLDPGRPTVYATLGTVHNRVTPLFQAIFAGLRDEPINLIVSVGRNRDPGEFGEQPHNVRVERYIPQSLLLPHCDLVVTHGGSGTIMDALSLGLPMVIVPVAADQPENAQRCEDLGAARTVHPEGRTPEAIRDAVREVLSDARFRQSAHRIRDEIEALPGIEYAVALLEKLAAEGRPIVAQTGATAG